MPVRISDGVRTEAFIHTDPLVAWRAWTDATELPRWFPGLRSVAKDAPGDLQAGAKIRFDGTSAVDLELIEVEAPNTLTYRLPSAYGDLQPHTGTLWVKPSLTGTEIDWIIKLDSDRGFLGIGGPKRAAENAMKRALRALKELVESESYRRPEVGGGERRRAWDDI